MMGFYRNKFSEEKSVFAISSKSIRIMCFWLYIVLSPLNIISVSFGWSIMKYITLAIMFIYILLGLSDIKITKSFPKATWILYILYVCFTLLWSQNIDRSFTIVLGKVETALFALLLINDSINKKTQKHLESAFLISGSFIIAFVLFFGSLDATSRIVINGTNVLADGNEINTYLIMPIVVCFKRLFRKNKTGLLALAFYLAIIIASLYVCLLTGSRSGLISLLVAIGLSIALFNKLKIKQIVLCIVALAAIYLFVVYVALPSLPTEMLQRYSIESIVIDKGSERLMIWEIQWNYLINNPTSMVIGYGMGGINEFQRASHNVFLQEIVCGGFVGLFLFSLFLFSIIKHSLRQHNLVAVIGILSSLTIYLFLSLNSSNKATWLIFMYALYNLKEQKRTI